jgi:hypothetical protein
MQGDVSDLNALRSVLEQIKTTYGPGAIKNIIHTAASVNDATIDSVTVDAFDHVLRPKVHGAYNLHLLTVELGLHLDSFVLFSSIRYAIPEIYLSLLTKILTYLSLASHWEIKAKSPTSQPMHSSTHSRHTAVASASPAYPSSSDPGNPSSWTTSLGLQPQLP